MTDIDDVLPAQTLKVPHMENSLASTPYYESRVDYAAIVLPVLIWIIAMIVVNPTGNFPLEDDWSYSLAVRHLVETGEFRPHGWTSMSLLGETLWGALFALPAGFSFFALRVSTLVAGALGLAGFATLLQQAGCESRKTVLATIVLGFNPIYFVLAATFMTDVAFTATCIFSALFFWRYLHKRHTGLLVVASLFALWSVSIRQLGLFLPLAMLLTLFAERRKQPRAILVAVGAVLASVALLKGLSVWLDLRHATPPVYLDKVPLMNMILPPGPITAAAIEHRLGVASWFIRAAFEQLGWALFPLLAWRLPALAREYLRYPWGKLVLLGATLGGAAWIVAQTSTHHLMPFNTWTTIHASGVGPIWQWDAKYGLDVAPLPSWFWLFVTCAGMAGAVILLLDLALVAAGIVASHRARRADATTSLHIFLLLATCIYLAPCVLIAFYDRYMLPVVFPLIALVVLGHPAANSTRLGARGSEPAARPWITRLVQALGVFTLVITSVFAVAGTHDYLAWNRAKWMLIDTLLQRGVPVDKIDGGYEFNGLYLYYPAFDVSAPHLTSWWVRDPQYVIQFMPRPGYREIDSADAHGWLPPLQTRIVTLQRETP
jgi:hypothetical protein